MPRERSTPNDTSEAAALGEFIAFWPPAWYEVTCVGIACRVCPFALASGGNLEDNVMVDVKTSRFKG
jgi:hypothetical protein